MTPGRLAQILTGLVLASLLVAGAAAVGAVVARRIAPARTLAAPVRLAIGLAVYAVAGSVLGLLGLFRPVPLAVLAILPGVLAVIRRTAGSALRTSSLKLERSAMPDRWLALPALAAAATYLAAWTLPTFHHDVVGNYLGVPAAYLVQGNAWPLPWSVFSSASLVLHGLVGFPAALDAVLPWGPFLVGWGEVWGGFHLLAVLACAWVLAGIVERLAPDGVDRRGAGLVGVLVWLTLPQSLLLAALELVEFLTTFVALALARHLADPDTRGDGRDGIVAGLLGGFLVAAKPQLGAFAAVAVAVLALRARSLRPVLWSALGSLPVMLPQLVRNALAYGSPLFPWLGGGGAARSAADDWLSVNAVGLPGGALELAGRVIGALTLQPEAGIAAAAAVAALAALTRGRWWPWALATLPLVATAAASDAAYHVLRWSQASLALLAGLAGIGLCRLLGTGRWRRAALAAGLLAALLPAVRFTCGTIGGCSQLAWPAREIVASHIPSLDARARLVTMSGTVLYLGELDGLYGIANGVLPSPHDGRAVLARYASADPGVIRARLRADGIAVLAVDRAFDGILGERAPWNALSPAERAAFARLLATLEPVDVPLPVRAYRVADGTVPPAAGSAPRGGAGTTSRDR